MKRSRNKSAKQKLKEIIIKMIREELAEGMWSKGQLAAFSRKPRKERYFITTDRGERVGYDLKTMSSVRSFLHHERSGMGWIPADAKVINIHDMKKGGEAVEQYFWKRGTGQDIYQATKPGGMVGDVNPKYVQYQG